MHQTNGNGIVESLPSLARTVAVISAYNEERFILICRGCHLPTCMVYSEFVIGLFVAYSIKGTGQDGTA